MNRTRFLTLLLALLLPLAFTACGDDDTSKPDTSMSDVTDAITDTNVTDTNVADTNVADTNVADTMADTNVADTMTTDTTDATDTVTPVTDACLNTADLAIVQTTDVSAQAGTCGLSCILDADIVSCSQACLSTETGLSADCAGCFAEPLACIKANCITPCAADPAGAACATCKTDNNCSANFVTCSGLVPPTCTPTGPELTWEDCSDGADNDCDDLIDGAEPGCSICPTAGDAAYAVAESTDALCGDGIDNDCDGYADCADFDCSNAALSDCVDEVTNALCSDGLDNNGDGRTDCYGRACTEATAVTVCDTTGAVENDTTLCADGLDNDADDRVDCDDADCQGIGYCAPTGQNEGDVTDACSDGKDNDGDGHVDCRDSNCAADAYCMGEGDAASCADGLDNDNDGMIDCADPSCYQATTHSVCFAADEICDNTTDDDEDGLADCFDPECNTTCSALACSTTNPVGTCTNAGEVCAATGECLPPNPDTAGQIVITEIMQNPATINDSEGEYFEVLNTSTTDTYNLGGCVIENGNDANHTIASKVLAAPGAYVTFSKAAAPGFTPDYVWGAANLGNGADTLSIVCGGVTIDTVAWDGGPNFPDPIGASMNLNPNNLNATDNDTGANWCTATTDLGNTDLGTPGAANDACN